MRKNKVITYKRKITMKNNIDNKVSISKQVQELAATGITKSEIQKIMSERLNRPIRYQHIFNILRMAELKSIEQLFKDKK